MANNTDASSLHHRVREFLQQQKRERRIRRYGQDQSLEDKDNYNINASVAHASKLWQKMSCCGNHEDVHTYTTYFMRVVSQFNSCQPINAWENEKVLHDIMQVDDFNVVLGWILYSAGVVTSFDLLLKQTLFKEPQSLDSLNGSNQQTNTLLVAKVCKDISFLLRNGELIDELEQSFGKPSLGWKILYQIVMVGNIYHAKGWNVSVLEMVLQSISDSIYSEFRSYTLLLEVLVEFRHTQPVRHFVRKAMFMTFTKYYSRLKGRQLTELRDKYLDLVSPTELNQVLRDMLLMEQVNFKPTTSCCEFLQCFFSRFIVGKSDYVRQVFQIAHEVTNEGIISMSTNKVNQSLSLVLQLSIAFSSCSQNLSNTDEENNKYYLYNIWFSNHFGHPTMGTGNFKAYSSMVNNFVCENCQPDASTCHFLSTKRNCQFIFFCFMENLANETSIPVLEITIRVMKQHQVKYSQIVMDYCIQARAKFQQLHCLNLKHTELDQSQLVNAQCIEEIHESIKYFLEVGRISNKLRQRHLFKDPVWEKVIKPYLLNAEIALDCKLPNITSMVPQLPPNVLLFGWTQLVHSMVKEKMILIKEYEPFLASIEGAVQQRLQ